MTAPTMSIDAVSERFDWADDNTVGTTASDVRRAVVQAIDVDRSEALGRRRWELETACVEAVLPNWDGYGARAVDPEAYIWARALLDALPLSSADPEISVDPDGEISLTWRRSSDEIFSVSVGGTGRLSYAGLFGVRAAHGTEYFSGKIPLAIQDSLARLYPAWR